MPSSLGSLRLILSAPLRSPLNPGRRPCSHIRRRGLVLLGGPGAASRGHPRRRWAASGGHNGSDEASRRRAVPEAQPLRGRRCGLGLGIEPPFGVSYFYVSVGALAGQKSFRLGSALQFKTSKALAFDPNDEPSMERRIAPDLKASYIISRHAQLTSHCALSAAGRTSPCPLSKTARRVRGRESATSGEEGLGHR